jgi:hypothetical protein
VPKTKPTPANNNSNKLKPVKVLPSKTPVTSSSSTSKTTTTAAASASKPDASKELPQIVEPDKDAQKEEEKVQSSILTGENWKVTISSKHELEASADLPHKVVTITPKTPPPGEVKVEAKKVEAKKKVNTFYNPIYFNCQWNDGILVTKILRRRFQI